MLKQPLMIINLKQYEESLGSKPLEFAKIAKELSKKHGVTILIAPPSPMLGEVSKLVPTLSQHVDPYEPGARTGALIPMEVKEMGCVGTLINHSEKRIPHEDVGKCVELCRKHDLVTVVCVKDDNEARELAKFKPDFIAVEPPELIGGDICVSVAKPEIIKNSVKAVKDVSPSTQVLCGAGVKHTDDVQKSLEMGARGVLLASGVVRAKDVRKAMEDLVMGMK
jgi:triosephosphate isomerase (TIM)